jgi:cation diffusion facilitator CzcD-associated flavoprotein CzcO
MTYSWAVVGAGPAGIAAVGMLLDSGILPNDILWIDQKFAVGDLGLHWQNVQGNTKTNLFLKFLNSCKSFGYADCPHVFEIHNQDPENTCLLKYICEPLQWITDRLKSLLQTRQDTADKIVRVENTWQIFLKQSTATAHNVILAVGSIPKILDYTLPVIPLRIAIDPERLQNAVTPNDTVAVFGSSHSAVLVIRNLIEMKVKKIVNFYRSSFLYAVYYEDWILYDDSGLKGSTAEWAREFIDKNLLANLVRVKADKHSIEEFLPQCDKAVYAVGFEKRVSPIIENCDVQPYTANNGQLAPGLFGLGIAYPEKWLTQANQHEYRVGLWKFMEYLQRVMPLWIKYNP